MTTVPTLCAIRVFHRVLELSAAHAVFHRQVLHRLHVKRDAFDLRHLRLQPADNVRGACGAFVARFEVDLDAAAVGRQVGAVHADERGQALHVRIFKNDARQRLLAVRQRLK